eukprot:GEZU01016151.1.p1 GENE.GEZU01016151.1~~GEZU01016151.1.p1  ORF type:complete len:310 (-),score=91.26 GEZU01016151.1:172-1101(-)
MKHCIIIFLMIALAAAVSASVAQRPTPPEYCEAEYPFCLGGESLSHVDPGDVLDVYYMEAPVFAAKVGPILGYFNLYHTAIGFVNRNTGANWTVEYDAIFEVGNATLPFVVGDDVVWCNQGAICTLTSIDFPYYTSVTHMAIINGKQFNDFYDWAVQANDTYTTYELWNVFDSWKEGNGEMYVHSLTCGDAAWVMFGKLKELGALWTNESFSAKHDFINLYSEPPIPVDVTDPKWAAEIVNFYKDFQWKGKTETEIAMMMMKFLIHDKFIFVNNQYYFLKMKFPYFGFHYAVEEFPDPDNPPNEYIIAY